VTRTPCPACPNTRAAGQYLCPTCWAALPRAARRALLQRGAAAMPRLRQLHDQLAAGIPLRQIHITDPTGNTPMDAEPTLQVSHPSGVHRFLVTAGSDMKMKFWGRTATYSNWIEGRASRHDNSRETWLITVYAVDGQRFITSAMPGVTIEEIVSTNDSEQYELRAGEPGTGWAEPTPASSAEQKDSTDTITGQYGTAGLVPPGHLTDTPATLAAWIISAPHWHPAWSQYLLAILTLADIPGTRPATIYVPGATHELIVAALNPEPGPHAALTATNATLGLLRPVNIAQQFTATDARARELAALCVRAVVGGVLNPETGDAPDRIRAVWARSIAQTLDHDTDPHHGRAN
jgi:hypothetical protein